MVVELCNQLLRHPEIAQVILTLNVEETVVFPVSKKILLIRNTTPKGFASNHNAAFLKCKTKYFVVLNPDVELCSGIFSELTACMLMANAKLIAPLVTSSTGQIEDSVRHFPTVINLIMKAFGKDISRYPVYLDKDYIYPDWVAGMFMMFDSVSFAAVGGFDEAFFLYYEDVDICLRFWKSQYPIAVSQRNRIVHNAHRESRKKIRFMIWHLSSLIRYFYKHVFRLPIASYVRSKN
ncbi:glycosyltransferase family protein [Methylophilus medardicus]|uniref:Glycosyltransferase family 2 protein n=1 Tax=Methylophilus medardicus TaxID=2588534 RepID=A0A5B8CSM9_9PROT|nr:glycosyltransferase family 2 protein [Methylophilus medardicus]QDC44297.1 glycosyltransferase family 2 protein [Methylophilus medardicus]QDC49304.1 glycosyltransferase family 2 protein [Methylophilus medardicus]QDC53009.1 glycosyltransferase family 2 protein [Methylophilus medardicus]